MSRWIRDKYRDEYYKRAKASGYRSRASYKLAQLNRRHRLIRRGDRVLDLGCAPGGWSQVARESVGEQGLVVGVDIVEVEPLDYENVFFVVGDIMDDPTIETISSISPVFDVVISDASPKITGIWSRDHLLSVDLVDRALSICDRLLRTGGNFVAKVFQGDELDQLQRRVKESFAWTKRTKPKASRGKSSEVYLVGKGFRQSPPHEPSS